MLKNRHIGPWQGREKWRCGRGTGRVQEIIVFVFFSIISIVIV